MKWIALSLIAIGIGLAGSAKPAGEFGLPLYALIGWLSLIVGSIWLGSLIFIAL